MLLGFLLILNRTKAVGRRHAGQTLVETETATMAVVGLRSSGVRRKGSRQYWNFERLLTAVLLAPLLDARMGVVGQHFRFE